jgi:branched-chain amino acid transport system ATP-binding protein
LFNQISGLTVPDEGQIIFLNQNITSLKPNDIAQLGISRTFQNIRLFPDMTVFETVLVGTYSLTGGSIIPAIFRTPKFRKKERLAKERTEEILRFVGLWDIRHEYAAKLSYGNQRRVEIARALATGPSLLLLDEPTAGMNPQETQEIMELFTSVNQRGITILLIAHDMELVTKLSHQITVLNFGEKLTEGTPTEVRNNPAVIEVYMGGAKIHA